MRTTRSSITLLLATAAAATLALAGCGEAPTESTKKESPAHLEPIEGTDRKRIVLVPQAVKRLDIKTEAVRPAAPKEMEGLAPAGSSTRTAIPDSAILYDKKGAPFTYVTSKELEYVRQPVTLDGIKNRVAVMSAGPPLGTQVVTVGGVELHGVESGVGK